MFSVNTVLRRAMYEAGLSELDLSAELAVDPKTVRNWMHGQVPHPGTRAALAQLLGVDATILWPALDRSVAGTDRPSDLVAVYPRSSTIDRSDWLALFAGAQTAIGILTGSTRLLSDHDVIRTLRDRVRAGAEVRILLTSSPEGTSSTEPLPSALERLLMDEPGIELRLHTAVPYNSLYIADDQLLVNQHSYGVPAGESPVFHYRRTADSELFDTYVSSFELVWAAAQGDARLSSRTAT